MFNNDKRGAADSMKWIVVAVIVAVGLSITGIWNIGNLFSAKQPVSTTTGTTQLTSLTVCPDPSVTMTVGPMKEKFSPGTSMASENSRVYKNGIDQGSKADSATMTVSAGDTIENIYGIASSTYYADADKFTAPCAPFDTATYSNGAHELWRADIAYQVDVFQTEDGNINNGDVENVTVNSGDEDSVTIKIVGAADQAISPPRHLEASGSKIIVVATFNKSAYDETKFSFTNGYPKVSVPAHHANNASDTSSLAWEVPGCPTAGKNTCDLDLGKFIFKADTGVNPIGGGASSGGMLGEGDIRLSFYMEEFFRHTRDNSIQFGAEKDDGTHPNANLLSEEETIYVT